MRRTLFYIPNEFFELTQFNVGPFVLHLGWIVIGWIVFSIGLLAWLVWKQGWNRDTASYLPILLFVGIVFSTVVPMVQVAERQLKVEGNREFVNDDGPIVGLPIRGYGVMVMFGVIAGVAMSAYRARQMGLDPEIILSLAFWMFVAGIAGARLFHVIQYWSHIAAFDRNDNFLLGTTIQNMFSVTEGGLVVYGALIGGLIAALTYLYLRKLSFLAIGDMITPGMLIGLAIGRVGCLMNGCCFGGICEAPESWPAVTFPRDVSPRLDHELPVRLRENSPPYMQQRRIGLMHGVEIGPNNEGRPVIVRIDRDSDNNVELSAGDKIKKINRQNIGQLVSKDGEIEETDPLEHAYRLLMRANTQITITTASGKTGIWSIKNLPDHSRPVHPTQIYSAINAALMCLFLWSYYLFRGRDGEIFATTMIAYPIARFLLESIRNDEGAQFNTGLTISQLVSIGFVALGISLWVYLLRQPAGTAFPVPAKE